MADEMEDVDRRAGPQPRLQGLGGGARQPFDLDQALALERLQGRAEPPPLLVRLGELPVALRGRDHGQDPQRRLDQQRAETLAQLQVAHHRRAAGERQEAPALGVVQVLPGQARQLGDVVEAQADAQPGPALGLGETALESLQQLALEDGAEQLVRRPAPRLAPSTASPDPPRRAPPPALKTSPPARAAGRAKHSVASKPAAPLHALAR